MSTYTKKQLHDAAWERIKQGTGWKTLEKKYAVPKTTLMRLVKSLAADPEVQKVRAYGVLHRMHVFISSAQLANDQKDYFHGILNKRRSRKGRRNVVSFPVRSAIASQLYTSMTDDNLPIQSRSTVAAYVQHVLNDSNVKIDTWEDNMPPTAWVKSFCKEFCFTFHSTTTKRPLHRKMACTPNAVRLFKKTVKWALKLVKGDPSRLWNFDQKVVCCDIDRGHKSMVCGASDIRRYVSLSAACA